MKFNRRLTREEEQGSGVLYDERYFSLQKTDEALELFEQSAGFRYRRCDEDSDQYP